jgi:hypothetical protein
MGYTINDSDSRYNGWTNYATWRVNLEIFDGMDVYEAFSIIEDDDTSELASALKQYADELLTMNGESGLVVDYARAFLQDVNWHEIAEYMLDNIKPEAA